MQWLKRWLGENQHDLPWQTYRYLAIDLELSGLDYKNDQILSVAWVPVEPPDILLNQQHNYIIKTQAELGQSPAIHGLTREHLDQGMDLVQVLNRLAQATEAHANTLWLFHHAPLDLAFLREAHQVLERPFVPPKVIDTLALEHKTLKRRGKSVEMEGLSLQQCRARYDLGPHPAHNALEDAIATAELFLAYCYRNFRDTPHTLNSLL